jgi:hypothetical protein
MRAAPGRNSRKSPSCFAPRSAVMKLIPVTLPPGRLRLATRPSLTGSPPVAKTIGTVVVAALAPSAAGVLPTIVSERRAKKPHHRHRSLLRARPERPGGSRAAEQRDELAPPHHSITSSASCCSCTGTSRPRDLAVFRLITSSNLVGACTGSSPGFSPLRIRST